MSVGTALAPPRSKPTFVPRAPRSDGAPPRPRPARCSRRPPEPRPLVGIERASSDLHEQRYPSTRELARAYETDEAGIIPLAFLPGELTTAILIGHQAIDSPWISSSTVELTSLCGAGREPGVSDTLVFARLRIGTPGAVRRISVSPSRSLRRPPEWTA
jgi:hypothetical protein